MALVFSDALTFKEKRKLSARIKSYLVPLQAVSAETGESIYSVGVFLNQSGIFLTFQAIFTDTDLKNPRFYCLLGGKKYEVKKYIDFHTEYNSALVHVNVPSEKIKVPKLAEDNLCEKDEFCIAYVDRKTGVLEMDWISCLRHRILPFHTDIEVVAKVNSEVNSAAGCFAFHPDGGLVAKELRSDEFYEFTYHSCFLPVPVEWFAITKNSHPPKSLEILKTNHEYAFFSSKRNLYFEILNDYCRPVKNWDSLVQTLELSLLDYPEDSFIWSYYLAVTIFEKDLPIDFSRAKDLIAKSPHPLRSFIAMGKSLVFLGRFEELKGECIERLMDNPKSEELLYLLAHAYFSLDENRLGYETLLKILDQNPFHNKAKLKASLYSQLSGEETEQSFQEALSQYESIHGKTEFSIHSEYLFYSSRNLEAAVEALLQGIELFPKNMSFWEKIFNLELESKYADRLIELYRRNRRYIYKSPSLYVALSRFSGFDLPDNAYESARYFLQKAYKMDPYNTEVMIQFAILNLMKYEDYETARYQALALVDSEDKWISGKAHLILGYYYKLMNREQDLQAILEKMIAEDSPNLPLLQNYIQHIDQKRSQGFSEVYPN
jgi:tetratricopeptide (TPR) repeat protein